MWEVASVGVCVVWWFAKDAQVLGIVNNCVADSQYASTTVAYAAVVWAAIGRDWARVWRERQAWAWA